MFYQNFGDWSSLSKSLFGPFSDLQSINSRILEQITRENLEVGSSNLAAIVKYMQSFNKTKKAEDWIKTQTDFVSDMFSKSVNYAQEMLKICNDAVEGYRRWGNDNAEVLSEEKRTKN